MRKTLLLALALVAIVSTAQAATDYGFYVGGVKVNSDNYTQIVKKSSDITSGTVTYNHSTKTLTLKNIKMSRTGDDKNGIDNESCDGLKIVFQGTNDLYTGDASVIQCRASTTIECASGSVTKLSYGGSSYRVIYLRGADMTITGSGKLQLLTTKASGSGKGIEGNLGTEKLTLSHSGELTIETRSNGLIDLAQVIFSNTGSTTIKAAGTASGIQRVRNVKDMIFNDLQHVAKPAISRFNGKEETILTAGDPECDEVVINGEGTSVELNAFFSVSATKKVKFSKGNLQYQVSTNTWRFAERQYDYIGASNANISITYVGWIDLFGWGTGNNPTLASDESSKYPTFVDWGTNAISNGGNMGNQWRTLTKEEWEWLLFARSTVSGYHYAKATVNGVAGLIVLPDDWQTSYAFLTSIDDDSAPFLVNNLDLYNWTTRFEAHGAVFLPAAGFMNYYSMTIPAEGTGLYYISSTPYGTKSACYMGCDNSSLGLLKTGRAFGNSVRLVQDVNTTGILSADNAPLDDDDWYTLDGVKLQGEPTQPGIYVHNGKKTIVK